jgi:ABC-type glycerol-3-phosphate transport system substrate-binding protein
MTAAVAAHQPPDIYLDSQLREGQWASEPGLVENLKSLLPAQVVDSILPAYKSAATVGNTMFMLPVRANPIGFLTVNKALLPAGTSLPANADWSFAEFESTLSKTAVSSQRWPLAVRLTDEQGDYDWQGYLWGYGCRPFSADLKTSTINSPACVKGLQWLIDANKKGLMAPGATTMAYSDAVNYYYTGRVVAEGGRAAQATLDSQAKTAGKVTVPLDSALTLFPHADGTKPPGPSVTTVGYQVFHQTDAAKKKAIGEFITFLAQPQYLTPGMLSGGGSLPTINGIAAPSDAAMTQINGWVQKYGVVPLGASLPAFTKIRVMRVPLFQAALLGQMSATEALNQMHQKTTQLLAG